MRTLCLRKTLMRTTIRAFLTMTEVKQKKGTVKWYDPKKGFGFIIPDEGSKDLFVHQSDIKADGFRTLAHGELVEFKVKIDNNGRRMAEDVTGPGGGSLRKSRGSRGGGAGSDSGGNCNEYGNGVDGSGGSNGDDGNGVDGSGGSNGDDGEKGP